MRVYDCSHKTNTIRKTAQNVETEPRRKYGIVQPVA